MGTRLARNRAKARFGAVLGGLTAWLTRVSPAALPKGAAHLLDAEARRRRFDSVLPSTSLQASYLVKRMHLMMLPQWSANYDYFKSNYRWTWGVTIRCRKS